jgi:hypothetical protein
MLAYSVYYFKGGESSFLPKHRKMYTMGSHSYLFNLKCYQQQTYMPFVWMWLLMETDMLNQVRFRILSVLNVRATDSCDGTTCLADKCQRPAGNCYLHPHC